MGIYIDSKLEWHEHINYVNNKFNSSLYAMRKMKHLLNMKHLRYTVHYFIHTWTMD